MTNDNNSSNLAGLQGSLYIGVTKTGIAYRQYGAEDPLFLIHGGAGSWTHWIRNIEPLGNSFKVFALDSPGYGESLQVKPDIPIDDYISIVEDTVNELSDGSTNIRLSGFSFGSFIAGGVAARLSSRIHSLSLIGISGFERPVGRNVDLLTIRRLREQIGREPSSEEVTGMHRHNLLELMLLHEDSINDEVIAIQSKNVEFTKFDSRRLSWSGLMPEFLTNIHCPVYLVFGDSDRSVYPSIESRISQCKSLIPDVGSTIIESCGHWAQFEEASRVNGILTKFHL